MTEYEIYSYEAFRKKYQDDVREVPRATLGSLNQMSLERYIQDLKEGKPNLAHLSDKEICELMSITRNGMVTLMRHFYSVLTHRHIFLSCALLQLLFQEWR
jgi:ATP-dependent DNA helicase RecG